jgi:hypothetical protein
MIGFANNALAQIPIIFSWATPTGSSVGSLNIIIMLIIVGGVGLVSVLWILKKSRDNFFEAIIIMFILGTAGLVALQFFIGAFA